MLRELLDRLAYRYRLWSAESRSDNLGAGTALRRCHRHFLVRQHTT
jgi:hypothetical protein